MCILSTGELDMMGRWVGVLFVCLSLLLMSICLEVHLLFPYLRYSVVVIGRLFFDTLVGLGYLLMSLSIGDLGYLWMSLSIGGGGVVCTSASLASLEPGRIYGDEVFGDKRSHALVVIF